MKIPYYHIDAFTDKVFGGNPAGVCPLTDWLADDQMQNIAAENKHSETAFFVPQKDGYRIRYFTPTTEINLCGHATLASAFVVFNYLEQEKSSVKFQANDELLEVVRDGGSLRMTMPRFAYKKCDTPQQIVEAFKKQPSECYKSETYIAVFDSENDVKDATPKLELLKDLDTHGVTITAPGNKSDFVSRFFGPAIGVPEDPATGVANCLLTPYWSERIEKKKLTSIQLSKRGAKFECEDDGDRVILTGQAVTYLKGEITL